MPRGIQIFSSKKSAKFGSFGHFFKGADKNITVQEFRFSPSLKGREGGREGVPITKRNDNKWNKWNVLAAVVQRLDNAIQWINNYPVESAVCFANTYPLDSDLSPG